MNQFGSPWYNKTMKNTSSTRSSHPATARCTVLASSVADPRKAPDRSFVSTHAATRFVNDRYGSQDVALRAALESASPVRW